MQDRIARIDENLLHRTAGPYKRVIRDESSRLRDLPVLPRKWKCEAASDTSAASHKQRPALQKNRHDLDLKPDMQPQLR